MRPRNAVSGRGLGFEDGGNTGIITGFRPGRLRAGRNREGMSVPQIIFFAVVGVAAYVGYRAFLREAERVTAKIRRHEDQARTGSMGTLVYDPKTGEYRPAKD